EIFTLIMHVNFCFSNLICIFAKEDRKPNASEVIEAIKESINARNMKNTENLLQGRNPKATTILRKAWSKYTQDNPHNSAQHNKNTLSAITRFSKWIEETGQDRQSTLSTGGLERFKTYLLTQGGSPMAINKVCKTIKMLINSYASLVTTRPIAEVKYNALQEPKKAQEDSKRQPLTREELKAFSSVETNSPKEEEARDIFTALCLIGCRAEDLHLIFNKEYEEINGFAVYTTAKTKTKAHTPLTEEIRALQTKYAEGFREWDITNFSKQMNTYIKRLAKRAHIDRQVTYTDQKGNTITTPICDLITIYCARHTFVTLKLEEGYKESDIKYMTAHEDEKMIQTRYGHYTAQIVTEKLSKAIQAATASKEPNKEQESANAEELIKIGKAEAEKDKVKEYKEVLAFCGVPYQEYAQLTTSEDLFRIIAKYEAQAIKKGYSVERLKELFNHYAQEDYAAFRRVIESL
ncbi:hypothetical protein IJ556_06860, partial [bacterium]|nr:hypothetical protein [bacterium]